MQSIVCCRLVLGDISVNIVIVINLLNRFCYLYNYNIKCIIALAFYGVDNKKTTLPV